MNSGKAQLTKDLNIASKKIPADTIIKNGKILDVFNLEWIEADVAISDGKFVGIGHYNEAARIIDAKNRYVCPSFIDGHVHIESSMVTPEEYAKVVVPHGVTAVVTDPHEIANVTGEEGLEFMLQNADHLPLEVFFMLPSCVPATPFEHSGANLTAADLEKYLTRPSVLGLAEVMDYPSLLHTKDNLLDKITMTHQHGGKLDGHLAGLETNAVNLFRTAGITTDHECTKEEEALERLRRGMYLMIREGSAAKDLNALIPVVTAHNARRCLFCTDDKHLDELIKEGSIDHNVRLSIQHGVSPQIALQMASLNAAECYGLTNKGAIAPGYDADFLILEDLEKVKISDVYKQGQRISHNSAYTPPDDAGRDKHAAPITDTVHFPDLTEEQLKLPIGGAQRAHIIKINPNQLLTNKLVEEVETENGIFVPSPAKDHLKLAVVERHKNTGHLGIGIVKGFGLKDGAIATTIAHDSHNIVALGANDPDLLKAIHTLKEINGGLVIVKNGAVLSSLPLPIAGLMSDQSFPFVKERLEQIGETLPNLGFTKDFNPFLTLSFLTLPVIPSLKLTDMGLFDVETFQHIEVSL
ncbi:adenine deaminase [Halobacillus halophilus]|uniref:Adenine deaminase n=1 Tax=Halobacillus halophilus (strain ATCC 35676 / DSM 2266 / JCM 20832 / KCTC 3685 / LMG 17431 / NBRC 102448 / NCIMB 2269) TaxID=866895 RepID=I0JJW5_HALH3|nr:adenine deaminase [Halobacillus halophilus]ASF38585.1 adenine deaminase [Halobacillus halophilus]CCG44434.1 adenine deaminase [Halobacillus halophilus DSM 2266]